MPVAAASPLQVTARIKSFSVKASVTPAFTRVNVTERRYAVSTVPARGAGVIWRGTWNSSDTYQPLDAVEFNGSSYVCTVENTNQDPTHLAYWDLLAEKGALGDPGPVGPAGSDGAEGPSGPSGIDTIEPRTSDPASPAEGRIWLRTDL